MARPCSACSHPERSALDALLTERHSATSVAGAFGLSPSAVMRHARGHLGRARSTFHDVGKLPVDGKRRVDAPIQKSGDVADYADPLAELVAALRVRALAGDAAAAREYRLALAAQTADKRAGAPPVDLSTTPEWIRLRTVILKALTPFPEARLALADALELE